MRKLLLFLSCLFIGCGTKPDPNEREILDLSYSVVRGWYERYPSVRPLIDEAMRDDIITFNEWLYIRDTKDRLYSEPPIKESLKEVIK